MRHSFWFMIELVLFILTVFCTGAIAQQYPNRPVRIIVGISAGGGVDTVARIIAQKMTQAWGQSVVVENRTGAGGIIGTEAAAKAAPDGYTLLMSNSGSIAVDVSLFKKLPYNPVTDFAPITLVARIPALLLVHPSLPVNSVKNLIALAKAHPGQITFGSVGKGTPGYFAAELFRELAQIEIVNVPYRGTPQAMTDVMSGQISMMFGNVLTTVPVVNSGKLKALGVTSARRLNIVPNVPTISEAGLAGYEHYNWYGVLAPARTPKPVVAKLNQEIVRILKTPEVGGRLSKQGLDVVASSPEEFAGFLKSEIDMYAKLVKAAGIPPE